VTILTIPQYDCTHLLRHRKERYFGKMLSHMISGRLVTDSVYQSASQNWSNHIDIYH